MNEIVQDRTPFMTLQSLLYPYYEHFKADLVFWKDN
jgi:hypothetical protein